MPKLTLDEFRETKNSNAVARDYVDPHLVSTIQRLAPEQTDDGMGRYLTYTSIDGAEVETWGIKAALERHALEVQRTRDRAIPHGRDE